MVLLWPADMRQEYRKARISVDPLIWEPVFTVEQNGCLMSEETI